MFNNKKIPLIPPLFHGNEYVTDKAHGHNKISIRMIRIWGKSICKLLQFIFNQCIDTGSYPLEWKKAN